MIIRQKLKKSSLEAVFQFTVKNRFHGATNRKLTTNKTQNNTKHTIRHLLLIVSRMLLELLSRLLLIRIVGRWHGSRSG